MNNSHFTYTPAKENSRSSTLRLLFAKNTLSRTEIAATLNISTAAVTVTTKSLLDAGILIPCEDSSQLQNMHKAGRKQALLSINPNWKYVLAIEIFTDYVNLAVTDLLGYTIIQKNFPAVESFAAPKSFCEAISRECRLLIKSADISPDRILGAGISVQGAVDHINGIAMNPYLMEGPVPFKEYFSELLQMPVAVESNVCSVLQSELTYRTHIADHDNVLMLKWGPGVGSAMAIGGAIYKGYQFQSPEIGHNTFSRGKGLRCRCGRRGCLETTISEHVITSQISRLLDAGKDSDLNQLAKKCGPPSANNLSAYLDADIPALRKLIQKCMEKLVNAVHNAVIILAPDQLVLYGQFFKSDWIFQSFVEMLMERNPIIPKHFCVRNTTLNQKPFVGCTAVAIEQILFSEDFSI